jgi:hypothetical protein
MNEDPLGGRRSLRALSRWVISSWLRPADSDAGWQQRAGRRLRLGESDVGPQRPPTSSPEKNPAKQAGHAAPQSH